MPNPTNAAIIPCIDAITSEVKSPAEWLARMTEARNEYRVFLLALQLLRGIHRFRAIDMTRLASMTTAHPAYSRRTLLEYLIDHGLIDRNGSGAPGDPYLFTLTPAGNDLLVKASAIKAGFTLDENGTAITTTATEPED